MAGQWQQSSHENYFREWSRGHTQETQAAPMERKAVSARRGQACSGGALPQGKRAGSALCRRPRTPALVSLNSGLFTAKQFQDPHQFFCQSVASETPLPAATLAGRDNDKDLMAADVTTEHVGTFWRPQQSRHMGTEMLCYF